MKKAKLMSLILIGVIVFSCKKSEMENGTNQNLSLDVDANKTVVSGGPCGSNFITNMLDFITNWGIGSTNYANQLNDPYFATNRLVAHNAVYTAYRDCYFNGPPGEGTFDPAETRKIPFLYFLPPGNLDDWLTFIGATDLCNQNQVDAAKAFIAPLNVIIKRTVDDVGPSYYSSSYSNEDRFDMIVRHISASEITYLDASHANSNYRGFLYLKAASSLFKIPNIVANKLFDKPLAAVDPVEGGSPTPIIYENWEGFVIDHTAAINVLSGYCNTPPPATPLYLPSPLPNPVILYFLTISDAQNTIVDKSLDTPIFLNILDSKYYTDSSLTSFVPNGYYKHPNDILNNNYYHISNGLVTGIVEIIIDPNAPVGP